MRFLNDAPVKISNKVTRFRSADYLLTITCTTRTELRINAICTPVSKEEQPGIRRSKTFNDGLGSSLSFGGDHAPYKPRTDVTLTGTGYVPGGGKATSLHVTFGVGDARKSLDIVGDRFWVRGLQVEVSPPKPFDRMPLRLENAFGGIGSPFNPWGKGFGVLAPETGALLPAANIHPAGAPHARWDVAVPPAGFGPLSEDMPPRSALRGSYDAAWLYKRNPLPPEDFDWGFYNVAPADQQFTPYLRGDETLYFENLHPTTQRFTSRLPGLRLRVLLRRRLLPTGDTTQIEEVPANLDSVHVDADAMTVDLAWRAVASTTEEQGRDVTHCYVAVEPLADAPRPLAEHVAAFEVLVNPPPAPPPPPPPPPPPDDTEAREQAVVQDLKEDLADFPLSPAFHADLAKARTPDEIDAALMAEGARVTKAIEEAVAKHTLPTP